MDSGSKDLISAFVARKNLSAKLYHEITLSEASRTLSTGKPGFTQGDLLTVEGKDFWKSVADIARTAKNCTKVAVLVPAGYIGLDYGLSFPDKDISLLGIGRHRYFLFHSALGVFILKKFYDWYLVRGSQPNNFISRVNRKIFGALIGGAAVGVGVHLLVDVFQPKAVIFPFFGSLVDDTLVDDRLWLLGNSLWCFKIARDVFVIAIGDELAAVKDYVYRQYARPLAGGVQVKGVPSGPGF